MFIKKIVSAVFLLAVCMNVFSLSAGKNKKPFAQYWISAQQIKEFFKKNFNINDIFQECDKSSIIDQQALKDAIKNCFDHVTKDFKIDENSNLGSLLEYCFGDSAIPTQDIEKAIRKSIGAFNDKELREYQQTSSWRLSRSWVVCQNRQQADDFFDLITDSIFNLLRHSYVRNSDGTLWIAVISLRSENDQLALYVYSPILKHQEDNQLLCKKSVVCMSPFCQQHGDLLNEVAQAAGPNLRLMALGLVTGTIIYLGLNACEFFMECA